MYSKKLMGLFHYELICFFFFLLIFKPCITALNQQTGQISPGFQASQSEWSSSNGQFLLSNNSAFSLGFYTALDVQLFVLVVIHLPSSKVVWTANRGLLVTDSDKFVFDKNGNVYLKSGDRFLWSTNTTGKSVKSMELQDSGNLVLFSEKQSVLWQSFSHPTDTLLPGQDFLEGMKLKSFPNQNNLYHYLEFNSGDLVLSAEFEVPQIYWSMKNDNRKTNRSTVTGKVHSVSLSGNSWNCYDQNRLLLWRFPFSDNNDSTAFWAVILGSDGSISFHDLHKGKNVDPESTRIPENPCSSPEPCDPYYVCYFENWCQCPTPLSSKFNCNPPNISSTCDSPKSSFELLYIGEKLDYFALSFIKPSLKSSLNACQEACLDSCSCLVLFFENSTGNCFLFDQIGSFQRADQGSVGFVSYMKVSSEKSGGRKNIVLLVVIVVATILVFAGTAFIGLWLYRKRKGVLEYSRDSLDDDFLDSLSGRPARFTYSDLCRITKNFSIKVGQGGFGSVYQGALQDGTQLAVKKLEGVGQGTKEFRSEVSIIGSIHHVHLVKLKGFCAEGPHRLLVYEFLGNGSLDRWIFKNNGEDESHFLDWNTRFNIALGTAKGLAYLHEECEVKIIHCDIKPENVLLDDNFSAKVSDFGLAKLMNREESLTYTTLRGTRGYLAPEWITNYAISEKSDVYSYGLVLLEMIGGRKNYDPGDDSERAHFPSYAVKMLEEGKVKEIVDSKMEVEEDDERVITAIRVALWCVQDDKNFRPSMTKVVQMLEGVSVVPPLPAASQMSAGSSFLKWSSGETSFSGLIDCYSDIPISGCRLSGPR